MKTVRWEERDGVGYVMLDRPPLNILNMEMMEEIREILRLHQEQKVVAFAAEGKVFSAGADVKEHLPEQVEKMLRIFSTLILELLNFPGITASLVHGGAYGGGCELAFSADIVLAESGARFSHPEILLGVFPPAAVALYPLFFPGRSCIPLILSGAEFTAEEFIGSGVVTGVFSEEKFKENCHEYLKRFSGLSGSTLRITKKALRESLYQDLGERLEKFNRIYLDELMKTQDAMEGLQAFLEKRKPVWKNR